MRQLGVGLTTVAPREFDGSANLIRQLQADFARWIATRSVVAHALIAMAYTAAFLLSRAALSAILTVIASPWVALAVGLALAAAEIGRASCRERVRLWVVGVSYKKTT